MFFFFMYTKTTYRFCSGSKLPSTHFSKNCENRQFQAAEGSQLPSTHFRKNAKKMQLKVAKVATYQYNLRKKKMVAEGSWFSYPVHTFGILNDFGSCRQLGQRPRKPLYTLLRILAILVVEGSWRQRPGSDQNNPVYIKKKP